MFSADGTGKFFPRLMSSADLKSMTFLFWTPSDLTLTTKGVLNLIHRFCNGHLKEAVNVESCVQCCSVCPRM